MNCFKAKCSTSNTMVVTVMAAVVFMGILTHSATGTPSSSATPPHTLLVLAASSLTNALPSVARAWKLQGGADVSFSFEATSRLARQITKGAPADLFFSADREWMDHVEAQNKIQKPTKTAMLSNSIVLAVPKDSSFKPRDPKDLVDKRLKHLALANESVPAGKFARASLRAAGVLDKIQDRIVSADNVRAALHWVEKKEAEAGIVFKTDLNISSKVVSAFVFDESSHPKIEYMAAVLQGTKHEKESMEFLKFCKGNQARSIFKEAGFKILED